MIFEASIFMRHYGYYKVNIERLITLLLRILLQDIGKLLYINFTKELPQNTTMVQSEHR